jgi:hypothetical protein
MTRRTRLMWLHDSRMVRKDPSVLGRGDMTDYFSPLRNARLRKLARRHWVRGEK